MAIIADHEGRVISERTKAALAAVKARGVKLGNIANLTNRDTKAATIAKSKKALERNTQILSVIAAMEAEHGNQSLRGMARLLNDSGYTTAQGKQWQATSVKNVNDSNSKSSIGLAIAADTLSSAIY